MSLNEQHIYLEFQWQPTWISFAGDPVPDHSTCRHIQNFHFLGSTSTHDHSFREDPPHFGWFQITHEYCYLVLHLPTIISCLSTYTTLCIVPLLQFFRIMFISDKLLLNNSDNTCNSSKCQWMAVHRKLLYYFWTVKLFLINTLAMKIILWYIYLLFLPLVISLPALKVCV